MKFIRPFINWMMDIGYQVYNIPSINTVGRKLTCLQLNTIKQLVTISKAVKPHL